MLLKPGKIASLYLVTAHVKIYMWTRELQSPLLDFFEASLTSQTKESSVIKSHILAGGKLEHKEGNISPNLYRKLPDQHMSTHSTE